MCIQTIMTLMTTTLCLNQIPFVVALCEYDFLLSFLIIIHTILLLTISSILIAKMKNEQTTLNHRLQWIYLSWFGINDISNEWKPVNEETYK